MTAVKAFIRTTKKNTKIKVRFRLSDGRGIQFFHSSEFTVLPELWDGKLQKYKAKCLIDQKERIAFDKNISDRKNLILEVYENNKPETSEKLDELIDRKIHPEKYSSSNNKNLIERIKKYTRDCFTDGIFGISAKKQYEVLSRELNRFFIINNIKDCNVDDFTSDKILLFRDFLKNEYKFVEDYPNLYTELKKTNIPSKERTQNTIAVKLKKLQAFFNEIEGYDEILVSPFRKLGKRKAILLKEQYDTPYYLEKDEFLKILNGKCPKSLQEAKDAFIFQCSLGCRIDDFCSLNYDNLAISNGIPYIHYLPSKTAKDGDFRKEINTPLMRFSLEIIKKYDFAFNILKYVSGERGYNKKIKQLLEFFEINRLVSVYNEQVNAIEYIPLSKLASSKLARKTHVDLMNKVQINQYAAGLHKAGSRAVERYTSMSIKDRFTLMCLAFGCKEYKVNEKLEVIE